MGARRPAALLAASLVVAAGQDIGYEALFESALDEFSSRCVKVSSPLPSWALGDFVIGSAGRFEMGDRRFVGMLDAYGKMHRFELREGEVCATYRMMATRFFNKSKQQNTITEGLLFFETEPPRHCPPWNPVCNMLAPNDNAFVNTIRHGGKLLSWTDGPTVLEVDPKSMDVTGTFGWNDTLAGQICYTASAHPVRHPKASGWIDFVGNAGFVSGATVRLYHLSEDEPNRRRSLVDIAMDTPPYMHSFGVTERHAVLPHMPVRFDPLAVALKPMHEAFKPEDVTPSTRGENGFRLVPLDGGDVKLRMLPADQKLYYTHTVNAYENDTGVVIDLCTLPDNPFAANLTVAANADKATRDQSPHNLVKRFLLPHADDAPVTTEVISDPGVATDFTKTNPLYQGSRHCFYWAVQWFTDGKAYGSMSIGKTDLCDGAPKRQWYRPNWFPSEAIFVPAGDGHAAEDDGVLLFTALDGVKGDTYLMVVNASTMETMSEVGPFPRIGFTTHGEFYPREPSPASPAAAAVAAAASAPAATPVVV